MCIKKKLQKKKKQDTTNMNEKKIFVYSVIIEH